MFPQLFLSNDIGLFILRVAVAIIFAVHAFPKLQNKMGSTFLLLGAVEAISAIALILGWYTRIAALLLAIVMIGAIYMKKFKWNIPFSHIILLT